MKKNRRVPAVSSTRLLERTIRSVIDRVLWTANASDDNKRILTEAIAEELCRSNATHGGRHIRCTVDGVVGTGGQDGKL